MKRHPTICTLALLVFIAGIVGPPVAAASDGFCAFSLAGTVDHVFCLQGPEPPQNPCYLRVLVEMDGEVMLLDAWCHGEMADVCAGLERDLPVIVLGEDDGESKQVTHVAVWLEPERAREDGAQDR